MTETFSQALYLVSAILFILGLKRLGSPATARAGNRLSALAMAIAVVVTLVSNEIMGWGVIVGGIALGTLIGFVAASRVEMTAMPQLVAAFNGFGGGASAFVAAAELLRDSDPALETAITIVLSLVIGALTLTGSFVAFAKLQGLLSGSPIGFPGQKIVDIAMAASLIVLSIWAVSQESVPAYWTVAALALVLGITRVLPIGGADMPVVIAFLNSASGLAAAAAGFVISSNILIIAGALVGASGLILTNIMVKAMNRSLSSVLFSAFGGTDAVAGEIGTEPVKRATADDVAIMLAYARRVVMVPGYGLAVAQAQHAIRDLASALEAKGVEVAYAIHPVAGRMPGHMNVLLAEADISYDKLFDLEEINRDFPTTDVALVVGANDVVNPSAKQDATSPIYGMPILDVDQATNCVVIKRSLSPGFAGIDNPLFYLDSTLMLFGDAKGALNDLVNAVAEV